MPEMGIVGVRGVLFGLGGVAVVFAVAAWIPVILAERAPASENGLVLLVAVLSAAALWSLALRGVPRNVQRIIGVGLALALLVALFAAAPATNHGPRQALLNLAQVAQLVAAGALVTGALWVAMPGPTSRGQVARSISALALCWQSLALLLYALGAQMAWGSFWGWTAWECWQLATWTATAFLLVGSREMGWDRTLTKAGVLLAAGLILLVLFGVPPLLGLLGQPIPAV